METQALPGEDIYTCNKWAPCELRRANRQLYQFTTDLAKQSEWSHPLLSRHACITKAIHTTDFPAHSLSREAHGHWVVVTMKGRTPGLGEAQCFGRTHTWGYEFGRYLSLEYLHHASGYTQYKPDVVRSLSSLRVCLHSKSCKQASLSKLAWIQLARVPIAVKTAQCGLQSRLASRLRTQVCAGLILLLWSPCCMSSLLLLPALAGFKIAQVG